MYAVKRVERGQQRTKEDYVNLCTIWLHEQYDASFRPHVPFRQFAEIWNDALSGAESTYMIRIKGLGNKVADVAEGQKYAQKVIEKLQNQQGNTAEDDYDDIPF